MSRPKAPTDWPITAPKTQAGKGAAELHKAWCEQFARVERVEADHAQARAELKAAEQAIADAETTKAAADAEKAYAAAKAALSGPWQARLQGPVSASQKAEWKLREHVTANLAELASEPELADAAEAAREAVLTAAQAQAEAFAEWRRVSDAHRALVGLADGIDGRAIPELTPDARAAKVAAEDMLAAERSTPVAGSNGLPAPRVQPPRV